MQRRVCLWLALCTPYYHKRGQSTIPKDSDHFKFQGCLVNLSPFYSRRKYTDQMKFQGCLSVSRIYRKREQCKVAKDSGQIKLLVVLISHSLLPSKTTTQVQKLSSRAFLYIFPDREWTPLEGENTVGKLFYYSVHNYTEHNIHKTC